jgi:hypothetical protein
MSSSAERMAKLRERQKTAEEAEAAEEVIERERERLADQDEGWPWQGLVGEEREQAIRAYYGYTSSETRTQEERAAAAVRMIAAL